MRWKVGLVSVFLLLSGCSGATGPPSDSQTEEPGTQRDGPLYAVGDWWQWRVESPHHPTFDVKTIVAHVDEDSYEMAMDPATQGLWLAWFHVPPHGQVTRPDLTWQAHGKTVKALDFPLHDKKRWVGELEGEVVQYVATRTGDDYDIEGRYEDGRRALTLTYSQAHHMIATITLYYGGTEPWATATVTAQGQDAPERGTVIREQDVYLGGASNTGAPTTARFTVPAGQDKILVGCLMQGTAGTYEIQVTPPQGPSVTCTFNTHSLQRQSQVQLLVRDPTPGEWNVRMTVGGQGSVLAEVTVFTIESAPGSGDASLRA